MVNVINNEVEMITFKVMIPKTRVLEIVDNLLTNAIDSGYSSWFILKKSKETVKGSLYIDREYDVYPADEGDFENVKLTVDKLLEGFSVMNLTYSKHFNDAINENDDAETADIFLQCCVLGDVIYG